MNLTDDRLRLILGHAMGLICVAGLLTGIARISIGKVEEATSYGLMPLIVALSNLCVLYGNWAWSKANGKEDKDVK